ncbi:hypothetical protein MGLY_30970 [Neomoorella glycerini]|uniref:Uncharacterized protein n=1 Tax=Neomoorella glycerini TaxID=55779 RepID=A0A6I5ZVE9_9FIRM|nr:hypothetical protein MGLY_30970 [Moorella glycerini]
MPFTAPTVANKGNRFHVGPSPIILVTVQEWVVFNIVQSALLLIPAWGIQPVSPPANALAAHAGRPLLLEELQPGYIELVTAERVLDSVYLATENLFQWSYSSSSPTLGVPVKVIACGVKNITARQQLVPIPPGSHALARAFYNYEILVTYADAAGHTATITLMSGPRWQRAFVSAGPGRLEVQVKVACSRIEITTPPAPEPGPALPYKPVRVWVWG